MSSSEITWPDIEDRFDTIGNGAITNTGFTTRARYFAESKQVEMIGNLWCDFAKQNRYLINNVPVKLRMIPSRPEFLLLAEESSPGYKFKITEVVFQAVMVKVDPELIIGLSEALHKKPAESPFNDSVMSIQTIPAGEFGRVFENLFSTECPSEVVVGLVTSQQFNGKISLNPFKFSHMDLCQIDLTFNGLSVFPGPFLPDYDSGAYLDNFLSIFNKAASEAPTLSPGFNK